MGRAYATSRQTRSPQAYGMAGCSDPQGAAHKRCCAESRAERVMERNNAGSAPHCDGNTRARASDSVTTTFMPTCGIKG